MTDPKPSPFFGPSTGRPWPALPDRVTPDVVAAAIELYAGLIGTRFPGEVAEIRLIDPMLREDDPSPLDRHLAVVFVDGDWTRADRIVALGELAFDVLTTFGIRLHGRPYAASEWRRGVDEIGRSLHSQRPG